MTRKKQSQCQIIYATSQNNEDVDYVIAIFTLRKILVLVAVLNLEQNHVPREHGCRCDVLWDLSLEATTHGTWI